VHKSEALTLRDIFLKMLMCTRGLSAEKAMEIQRHWSTPRAFVEAFEKCGGRDDLGAGGAEDEKARKRGEMVFRTAGGLVGGRKIGKALSAKVAEVWGEDDD
jgi:crossover junction endonuclease MUS81